jgi:hypothetical protein
MSTPSETIRQAEIVRRSNETIAVAPSKGRITPVVRRLFNCMLYIAQQHGTPEGPATIYRWPLADLARLAKFTSPDLATVKEHVRAMRENEVMWDLVSDKEERWGVSGMVSQVEIVRRQGEPSFVEWAFPPKISERLLDPSFYTSLSLQIHCSLRSGASIALYEICSRFATNPGHLTMRAHWKWWVPRLTGNENDGAHQDYKYFKRDVLNVALREVNAIAADELQIELIQHKTGRVINELQFRVIQTNPQSQLALEFDGELVELVTRLGLTVKAAREIVDAHDAEYIRKTVALTEERAADTKQPPLRSKAAYFKKALSDKYANGIPDKPAKPAAPKATAADRKRRTMDKLVAHRCAEALALYRELDIPDQSELREAFAQWTPVQDHRAEIRNRALSQKSVEVAFSDWYAKRLWGEPTENDLLEFMLSSLPD